MYLSKEKLFAQYRAPQCLDGWINTKNNNLSKTDTFGLDSELTNVKIRRD